MTTNAKGKAAIALIGLVGVFALLAASGDKAHAKRVPPPEDDDEVEPPAPSVPMPPPPAPTDDDAVVVETPGAEPAEVPIGDALIDDITYEEPDRDPLVQQVPDSQDDDGTWVLQGPWIARFTMLPQTGVSLQQLANAIQAESDTRVEGIHNGAVIFVAADEETLVAEQGQPLLGLPGVVVTVERLSSSPAMPPPPTPTGDDAVVVESPGTEPTEVPIGDALTDDDDQEPAEEVLPAQDDDQEPEDDDDVIAPPAPVVEAPDFPEPDVDEAEQPTTLAPDTAALLAIMLADETRANWKRKLPELVPWQQSRGLVADGEFGPKSATKMAEETGLLPIIRFWPKGSFLEGKWLPEYQHSLRLAAVTSPEPRASQLVMAAKRETGQGFGRGQQAISPTIKI